MVKGKVFIVDMREVQPEASGRVQIRERKEYNDQDSRLDLTMRGGIWGARKEDKECGQRRARKGAKRRRRKERAEQNSRVIR